MKEFLVSKKQFLQAVARETARMSYPGRMGGVVRAGTKKAVEKYFVKRFPMADVWNNPTQIARRFDRWHGERVRELGRRISKRIKRKGTDRGQAVAAKFLNTYLHQLMKYKRCSPLWEQLHLPLDRRTIEALESLKRDTGSRALEQANETLLKAQKAPYSIRYAEYLKMQRALLDLLGELNRRPQSEVKLKSRIELNLLWAE